MTKGRQHAISHANCWHASNKEPAALWNQYGGEEGAVAIKSSPERLKQALDTTGHYITYGEVEYIDINGRRIPNDPEYPVFFKRDDLEYEKEYRAVLLDHFRLGTLMANWPEIERKYEKYVGNVSCLSIVDLIQEEYSLEIDIDTLIQSVYVDPTVPTRFYKTIESVVSKYAGCDVIKSRLFNDPIGE